jgi:hypothetical protein
MRNLSIANFLLLILAILFGISLSSCNGERGNGKIKTEKRQPGDFDKIEITSDFSLSGNLFSNKNGNLYIRLIQSDRNEISIETDENIFEYVATKVDDGVLKIKIKDNPKPTKNIELFIYLKNLTEIDCSGLVTVESRDTLRLNKLKADFSGAVTVNLIVKADEIQLDMSGAGEAQLAGEVKVLKADGSGSIELNAENLACDDVNIEISGAGDAKVFVKNNLNVEISGAGNVTYKGNPTSVKQDISGAGTVNKAD